MEKWLIVVLDNIINSIIKWFPVDFNKLFSFISFIIHNSSLIRLHDSE